MQCANYWCFACRQPPRRSLCLACANYQLTTVLLLLLWILAFLCLVGAVVAMQGKKISHVLLSVGALRTAVWGDYWFACVMGCKCLQNNIFAADAFEISRLLEQNKYWSAYYQIRWCFSIRRMRRREKEKWEGNGREIRGCEQFGILSPRSKSIADRWPLTACMNCSMQKPHARDIFSVNLSTCCALCREVEDPISRLLDHLFQDCIDCCVGSVIVVKADGVSLVPGMRIA